MGDYTWLAAYHDKVYGAWTEVLPPAQESQQKTTPTALRRPLTAVRVGFADFSYEK